MLLPSKYPANILQKASNPTGFLCSSMQYDSRNINIKQLFSGVCLLQGVVAKTHS
jgi:hypothetical protein